MIELDATANLGKGDLEAVIKEIYPKAKDFKWSAKPIGVSFKLPLTGNLLKNVAKGKTEKVPETVMTENQINERRDSGVMGTDRSMMQVF